MSCQDCDSARLRFHHVFSDCLGCRARAASELMRSRRAGTGDGLS